VSVTGREMLGGGVEGWLRRVEEVGRGGEPGDGRGVRWGGEFAAASESRSSGWGCVGREIDAGGAEGTVRLPLATAVRWMPVR
jgi:hypothetical protein